MLEVFRLWLNGNREYWSGLVLYAQNNPNPKLLALMKKGATDFTKKRLEEELLSIFEQLKSVDHVASEIQKPTTTAAKEGRKPERVEQMARVLQSAPAIETKTVSPPVNEALYLACKKEADLLYKEVMNQRAILFASTVMEGYDDPNRPDLVKKRSPMAIDVLLKYQRVSQLYDRADYVRLHGKLPNENAEHNPDDEMEALPDQLVKQTLDNLRKGYNKLKNKEATPERLQLMQAKEKNIKKLEARWDLLKFQQ